MIVQIATFQECSQESCTFLIFFPLLLHYLLITTLLVSTSFSTFLCVITSPSYISILQPNVLITSNLLTWIRQLLLGRHICNCRIRTFNCLTFLSYPVYIYHITRRSPGPVPFSNTHKPCTRTGPSPAVPQQKWHFTKAKTQRASRNAIISELSMKQQNTNH